MEPHGGVDLSCQSGLVRGVTKNLKHDQKNHLICEVYSIKLYLLPPSFSLMKVECACDKEGKWNVLMDLFKKIRD